MPGMDTPERASDPSAHRSNCGAGVLLDLDGGQTHGIVEDGFEMLENLDHRGARGAEENTGDGAGMLIQKPHALFADDVDGLPDPDRYGVGQAFFPTEDSGPWLALRHG